jgi:hypothetical protein
VKELGDMAKKSGAGGDEDDVIYVEQEIGYLLTPSKNEQGDIALGSDEPEAMDVVCETLVPSSRGLLEAVERLVQTAHMLGTSVVDETRRLLAVDLLVKSAMEEGILDVELVNRPGTRDGDAEDGADRGWLHNRTKSLIEVHIGLLREPANDPTSLVVCKTPIRSKLVLEDPLP